MTEIGVALVLLAAVVLSGTMARVLPWAIPLPLVQIALGAAVTSVADLGVRLEPDIFFLLFLPPLLFLDGWRMPREGLLRNTSTILALALGLVFLTVLGAGLLIHWLIPAMPLSVSFALAAILSPTDPIAVSAVAGRVRVPKRMMHILEGESLLNDASGLVCMRFAVAATLTGSFSLVEAGTTFLWLALGGLAIGFGITFIVMRFRRFITRRYGEDAGVQILVSLLIPFGAYLVAEHLHCSGILAAVAAGITMSYVEASGDSGAITRMRSTAVWDSIQFAANGIIFVLLGEQLPGIFAGAINVVRQAEHHEAWWLAVYVIVINLALAGLRLIWVWVSVRFTMFRAHRRGQEMVSPQWQLILAASLAGVRGAITLAGILTLPLAMPDGSPFPARDLAIFLAAGVIILSLITASIGLPKLLTDLELPAETSTERQEDKVRVQAAQAAIQAIEKLQHDLAEGRQDADLYADVGARLMELYRRRVEGYKGADEDGGAAARHLDDIERRFRVAAVQAERETVLRAARKSQIPDELRRKLVRELDLMEARFMPARA